MLDSTTRRLAGDAALLGGSPLRLLRLRPAARGLLAEQPLRVRDGRSASVARSLLDAGVAHPRPVDGPTPAEVTVVIPVRDNPVGVSRLLSALGAAAQVIVVDDGSTRPDAVRTVTTERGARLLRHPVSRGPAAARNTGLAAVSTAFVAFLDSDVVPAPGWLSVLLAHMSDPAVGLVAPRVVALPGAQGWIARYETVRSSLDLGTREAAVVPRSRVAYVPSAAMLIRVSALGEAGFDEDMHVAEDVDLCWRLYARGWRLRYEPAATVAHQHRTEAWKWLARKSFYGRGAAPLAARHSGQVAPLVLAPWTAAVCALALSGRRSGLLAAALLAGGSIWRLARTLSGLEQSLAVAVELGARGVVGTAWQLASAAHRSYWPLTLLIASGSRRARRIVLVAGVLEGLSDWTHHRAAGGLGPVRYLIAKRLDDLAYGSGLWWGAAHARSWAALVPAMVG